MIDVDWRSFFGQIRRTCQHQQSHRDRQTNIQYFTNMLKNYNITSGASDEDYASSSS